MKVKVAVLADCANVAEGGKLNIMGIFSDIASADFPVIYPFMVLAMRLEFEFDDNAPEHELTVRAVDADGRELMSFSQRLNELQVPPGQYHYLDRVLTFPGIVIAKPGSLSFRIEWDGAEEIRVPLRVTRLPKST